MAKYYPKSQITPNLYTNGGEYMFASNSKEYIGYYYRISNGKIFAGRNFNSSNQISLIPLASGIATPSPEGREMVVVDNWDGGESYISPNSMDINEDYNNIKFKNKLPKSKFLPTPYTSSPTLEEIRSLEYKRYFAKRVNNLMYTEISKETYNKFIAKDPTVAYNLYNCLFLFWSLIDEVTIQSRINRNIVDLIEKNNKWYGFHHYFKGNFGTTRTISESLYTKGGEFLLPNRTNYIGFYHFMPDGTPMTGKSHGDGKDIALIQIKSTSPFLSPSPNLSSPTPTQPTTTQTSSPSTPSGGGGGGY